jgi:DNA-binding NarL/FixJ family response regulator
MEQRVRPFRVFVVEDSPLLRGRVETLLAGIPGAALAGHAADADGAVQAILASDPDAAILDLHLARGTGFDVLRGLRAAGARTAVYVLTNYPTDAYRATAEKLGARGFFDKSGEFERLRDVLAAAAAA